MQDRNRAIDIIGVQMDMGAERRGVDMGPSAIRYAGLRETLEELGYTVNDLGDIGEALACDVNVLSKAGQGTQLKNLDAVNDINSRLYKKVLETLSVGRFPLVLGGDHSLAAGSVTAIQQHFGKTGLIWIDAHGDFNNEQSTLTGNIHGTPLSAITGNGPIEILPFKEEGAVFTEPRNTVIIGAREFDAVEKDLIKKAGISVFTIADIDKDGMYQIAREAVRLATEGTEGFYLSLDLDAIDPSVAPGVGTPENGGLTYREAHLLCEYIATCENLLGFEVVELNPILDIRNRTGGVAVEMIASLLCKTIL